VLEHSVASIGASKLSFFQIKIGGRRQTRARQATCVEPLTGLIFRILNVPFAWLSGRSIRCEDTKQSGALAFTEATTIPQIMEYIRESY